MVPIWYKDKEGKWKVFPHDKMKTHTDGSQYLSNDEWIEFATAIGWDNLSKYCRQVDAKDDSFVYGRIWVFKKDLS